MTYKDRLMPMMSVPDLIIDAKRPRLGLAWWEAAVARALPLTWATIRLWDYPNRPREQPPSTRNAARPGPS
jgi:hypothetical protein